MKMHELQQRLRRDRPMKSVTLRIPEDVIADLKRVAPLLGFGGYQPLMRAYVGQGLRADLRRPAAQPDIGRLLENLRQRGVDEEVLAAAVADLEEEG
jgi:hypothetical protein